MTARIVLVCDVCGAVTDDHYAHPLPDARFRARALGWTRRRKSSGGQKNKPGPDRLWADLCPEHTYALDRVTEPIRGTWRVRPVAGLDPAPHPLRRGRPPKHTDRIIRPTVRYEDGDGPYRLYTSMVAAYRERGTGRGTIERLRREMFAPGVDFLAVAARWAIVETEEHDNNGTSGNGDDGGPGG